MNIHAPEEIRDLLDEFVTDFRELLKDNLAGIYLHGSLAMNCFNLVSSDIDILVVSRDKVPVTVREAMAGIMLKVAPKAPPKGIEMSVVTLHELKNFRHPMPFEFHFSNSWLEQYRKKEVDLSEEGRVDSDLAAHLTIVKARGVTLYGEPLGAVIQAIPSEYYKASIQEDAKDILADMASNPVYNVLNLCRVQAFLEAGLITSKREGGEWALNRACGLQIRIIKQALAEYAGESKSSWKVDALKQFGEEMAAVLFSKRSGINRQMTVAEKD